LIEVLYTFYLKTKFESIDKKFYQMINIFIAIVASFSAIATFTIWDRRIIIKPFKVRFKIIEENIIKK
jgi:hypothetical protein